MVGTLLVVGTCVGEALVLGALLELGTALGDKLGSKLGTALDVPVGTTLGSIDVLGLELGKELGSSLGGKITVATIFWSSSKLRANSPVKIALSIIAPAS